jgi:hypothetical protein
MKIEKNPKEYYRKLKKLFPKESDKVLEKTAVYAAFSYEYEVGEICDDDLESYLDCADYVFDITEVKEKYDEFILDIAPCHADSYTDYGMYMTDALNEEITNILKTDSIKNKLFPIFVETNFYYIKFHNTEYYTKEM